MGRASRKPFLFLVVDDNDEGDGELDVTLGHRRMGNCARHIIEKGKLGNYTKDHVCTPYVLCTNIRRKTSQSSNIMKQRLQLATLSTLVGLRVYAWRYQDVVTSGRLDRVRGLLERLAGDDSVDVWQW